MAHAHIDDQAVALQLCSFSPELEAELAARLRVVRWFDLDEAARADVLARQSAQIRVVVTGGHIGCDAELMQALPALGLVAVNGVGLDKVPLALAAGLGIAVTNTPGVLTDDVADLAVGLTIALMRQIPVGDAYVRSGRWAEKDLGLGRKVSGSRFGILGLGRIGAAIADRLIAFGEVGYVARTVKPVEHRAFAGARELADWCDVLIVACAATPETVGLVDRDILSALGPDGKLVNVSRGSVVDEAALIDALERGGIAGAALDVFANEPHVPDALRAAGRTVLTPHVASATVETRAAMAEMVVANIDAFLAGGRCLSPAD
ncbi:2-hydroxyacid dehydrogenase [Sphingomonas sp.]|uniref:2-hydroxyacid dehydrogenase n=1 Tax=Sphingomonas sp. TaxID=28214 RepID=UPI002DD678BD|nr:2-hydroxyacid dehydrogenase [Sphingomonas sp.]